MLSIHLFSEKPPKDLCQKKQYFRAKQKYIRFQRFYGNSLVGGTDQQKVIVVQEPGSKKKKGERKESKQVSLFLVLHNNIFKHFWDVLFE